MSFSWEDCPTTLLTGNSLAGLVWYQSQLCLPQVPQAPGLDQVQGQRCEAGAEHGGGVPVDWAGGGQVPGHIVWGPAGVVGPARCAREDQAGGDDGQHPVTR